METVDILKLASVWVGFIAITLMMIKLYLSMVKKPYRVVGKIIKLIIGLCITKVFLAVITMSLFGTLTWIFNTTMWIVIGYMDWLNEENLMRRLKGEKPLNFNFKEAFTVRKSPNLPKSDDSHDNYKNF
jgi:hypothetical protein